MPALARPSGEQQLAEYQLLTQRITIVSMCAIAGTSIKSGDEASNLIKTDPLSQPMHWRACFGGAGRASE
jgi:hypothetical protein